MAVFTFAFAISMKYKKKNAMNRMKAEIKSPGCLAAWRCLNIFVEIEIHMAWQSTVYTLHCVQCIVIHCSHIPSLVSLFQ